MKKIIMLFVLLLMFVGCMMSNQNKYKSKDVTYDRTYIGNNVCVIEYEHNGIKYLIFRGPESIAVIKEGN